MSCNDSIGSELHCCKKLQADWIWRILDTIQIRFFFFIFLFHRSLKLKICEITVSTFAPCGYETWSLTLRKLQTYSVWDQVQRWTCTPVREEVAGGWWKLLNRNIDSLCSSLYIIRVIKSHRMKWAEHEVCMGDVSNSCNIWKIWGKQTTWEGQLYIWEY
jgi:hypothetical protein